MTWNVAFTSSLADTCYVCFFHYSDVKFSQTEYKDLVFKMVNKNTKPIHKLTNKTKIQEVSMEIRRYTIYHTHTIMPRSHTHTHTHTHTPRMRVFLSQRTVVKISVIPSKKSRSQRSGTNDLLSSSTWHLKVSSQPPCSHAFTHNCHCCGCNWRVSLLAKMGSFLSIGPLLI